MPVPILPDFIFIIIRAVVKRAVLMKLIVGRSVHLLECVRELIG
jgi:hypothetical protein